MTGRSKPFRYIQVQDGGPLPDIGDLGPFKAIVIIDARPSRQWQERASRWLVDSGCLYMMAWGEDCGSWDDSVDRACLEKFSFGDMPPDKDVMTTWHADQTLAEVIEFAKQDACHPSVDLNGLVVLHLGSENRRAMLEALFDQS